MKKFDLKLLSMVIFITISTACSKDEDVVTEVKNNSDDLEYAVPLGSGSLNDAMKIDLGLIPLKAVKSSGQAPNVTSLPFTAIPIPSKEYIKETKLLDISQLIAGGFYHQIGIEDFYIAFFDRFGESEYNLQKLKSNGPPFGWNYKWNRIPFVENEYPEVLFNAEFRGEVSIVLSKPCTEFGFELAPNIKNRNTNFMVWYGNSIFDNSAGEITSLTTNNPSGARLFALKSTTPFNAVTILWGEFFAADFEPGGSAITNIRYKLAK